MASDLTIRQAQEQVGKYLEAKGESWTRLSNHYLSVTHLVEEVGELARAVVNIDAEHGDSSRRGNNLSPQEKLAAVQDSLGDVFYGLLAISIAYKLDLQTSFRSSMKNILSRYPPAQNPPAIT